MDLKRLDVSRFTGPVTVLTNPENAYSTVIVGSSSLFHVSLALGDGSNFWTWVSRTVRTAFGESQELISAAKLWAAMSFFVRFAYSFRASLKMVSKFGGEVEVDGSSGSWDIVHSKRSG